MCRAHGIPHQRVTAADDLPGALRSAWGSNRHSVVEVVTSRTSNVQRHREIQAAVQAEVERAVALLEAKPAAAPPAAAAGSGAVAQQQQALAQQAPLQPYELGVASASYHTYSLPLARPLTTAAGAAAERRGLLLRLTLAGPGGALAHGVGEVAPLPGLHAESLEAAEAQLAALATLLSGGVRLPLTAALLGGRLAAWLEHGLGVAPATLLPSVRCGLEAALLSALAQARGWGRGGRLGRQPVCCSLCAVGPAFSVPTLAPPFHTTAAPEHAAGAAAGGLAGAARRRRRQRPARLPGHT